jgi:hypothetical protein
MVAVHLCQVHIESHVNTLYQCYQYKNTVLNMICSCSQLLPFSSFADFVSNAIVVLSLICDRLHSFVISMGC